MLSLKQKKPADYIDEWVKVTKGPLAGQVGYCDDEGDGRGEIVVYFTGCPLDGCHVLDARNVKLASEKEMKQGCWRAEGAWKKHDRKGVPC